MQPNTTYKDLHARILAKIRSWMENQTPQLEREGDILVFGTNRITPVYTIPILQVDAAGKRVKLNAGEVHGLTVGTLLAAYPPAERNLAATEKRRALLEVTELVGDTDSWASITKEYGSGPIEQGPQAVLLGHSDPRVQRTVGLAIEDAGARQALETAVAKHGAGFIRPVAKNESTDFQVAVNARTGE